MTKLNPVNPVLLQLASSKVWGQASGDNDEKRAFQPPGGMPAAGGAPPADPSLGPGAPPGAGAGVPPMDPAMMGMDPSMMGGMPPGAVVERVGGAFQFSGPAFYYSLPPDGGVVFGCQPGFGDVKKSIIRQE